MLRDLGGLLYEVHRTGGGDFGAHRGVIGGKIERLSPSTPRAARSSRRSAPRASEAVVFEPGVGGTCDVCGELYGSAARFCSRCGTPTDAAAREAPAPAAEPRPVPAMPKAPGTAGPRRSRRAERGREAGETAAREPAAEAANPDETRAREPAEEAANRTRPRARAGGRGREPAPREPAARPRATSPRAAASEPRSRTTRRARPRTSRSGRRRRAPAGEAKTAEIEPADEPQDAGRNPFRNISNGRPEDKGKPPELSPGDPLAARESRK